MTPTPANDSLFEGLPPQNVTNGQLLMILQQMHAQQRVTNLALINLERDFSAYKTEHSGMVDAWKASKNVLRFIAVLGATAAAVAVVWSSTKGFFGLMSEVSK